MNSIGQLETYTVRQTQINTQGTIEKNSTSSPVSGSATTDSPIGDKTQISPLSLLLSDAAARAAARDASTSREGLAAIVQSTVDKLFGDSYTRNKTAHDAEVPDSNDPKRLAQAKQAADFANGKGTNPFKAMSRDQLALITYDDSGAFTIDERRAAWMEAYDQHEAWSRSISQKLMDEYSRNGKVSSNLLKEIQDYCSSLPAIEEAQLPQGYDQQPQIQIQQAQNNEWTPHKNKLQSLLDLLAQRPRLAAILAGS